MERNLFEKEYGKYATKKITGEAAKYGTLRFIGNGVRYALPPAAAIANGKLLSDIFGDAIRRKTDDILGTDAVGTKIKADMQRERDRQEKELQEWRAKNLQFVPFNPNPNF